MLIKVSVLQTIKTNMYSSRIFHDAFTPALRAFSKTISIFHKTQGNLAYLSFLVIENIVEETKLPRFKNKFNVFQSMSQINLCQFEKFSCFGCCGHDFVSREEIFSALKEQTKLLDSTKIEIFCSRETPYVGKTGICEHLIFKDGKVFCPCHPLQNDGNDLREPRCQKDHECETLKEFNKMSEDQKQKFLNFLRRKNLDWFNYSIAMDDGSLLKEFIIK